MAAEQEQPEGVVGIRWGGVVAEVQRLGRCRPLGGDAFLAPPAGLLAADDVDHAPVGHRHQPAPGVRRQAAVGPLHRGGQQGLLHGVLAQVELVVTPNQRAEDLRRQRPQERFDARLVRHAAGPASCRTGHTSTASCEANGISPAMRMASASSADSSR